MLCHNVVTGRDFAAAIKSSRQKVGQMSTPEGSEQKQSTRFFCNAANVLLNISFLVKKTGGFKRTEVVGTYCYTLGKIFMYVPRCKALHPNSLVFKTLKFQCLWDIAAQSLSQHQLITYCWHLPFHFSFVRYLSPVNLLYLSFCRLSLFQGKLPWSEFFVLLDFFLRNSTHRFYDGTFPVFLRPPSIPTLWYYIHN